MNMGKFAAVLSVLSLFLGGMLGYSYAFVRISQQLNEKKDNTPASAPLLEKAPQLSDAAPFPQIISGTTDKGVLPLDSVCVPVLDAITEAADATMAELNAPTSPLKGLARINECSRFFEDSLLEKLDEHPDLRCKTPLNKEGKAQRSGYPDLIITHQPTGRTYYLDPKLYEAESESSSLRTFYYTPRKETSKILKSAHHLLIGFAHNGKDGDWTFQSWSLVDLSKISLTLKSEYNASNRDLYQSENKVRTSH